MIKNKKVIVVMPAYNAEYTLKRTFQDIPTTIVDDVILVDDQSKDRTVEIAQRLGIKTIAHEKNRGYGGNQKTCYTNALRQGADIIIMLHPDYQYDPRLITAMASLISEGLFDCVLGSRILGTGALIGGMPLHKYISNRILSALQNFIIGYKLSEYHTGYRAYSAEVLRALPFEDNSENFLFDNQMLAQIIYAGFSIGEVTCPTRYDEDSSSINLKQSMIYGLGVLATSLEYWLNQRNLLSTTRFSKIKMSRIDARKFSYQKSL